MNERLHVLAAAPFEAARQVDSLPAGHRARNLHGHSFLARVRAVPPEGWAAFSGDETAALSERLSACVAALDYRCLNEVLSEPSDENLAGWIRQRLDLPGIESVGVQSTRDQGADLDSLERTHLWRRFRFESAHRLPQVAPGHPCGRLHGHGFEVILHARQAPGAGADMGVDFGELGAAWAPLHEALHLACLNDIPGLENPTSERLAAWIWQRLEGRLPTLSWVTVYETVTAGCHYDGRRYRIWKEQRFESALRLARAPAGDRRARLHGHSYLIRLHLGAPLDEVMGWTLDYSDVKKLFGPLYERLDHHRLDRLEDLPDADPGSLLRWIKARLLPSLPALDRLDLYETPGCGALLCWGEDGPALPV